MKEIIPGSISIYTIGCLFNAILSFIVVLIPLYGLTMGYSATEIGIFLSIPGIAQVFLRMFAGAFSDFLGEKCMLLITFGGVVIAGTIFILGLGFWGLVGAQFFMGISRSIYWPISQSYASRISISNPTGILGGLHSFVNLGKLLGILSGGWAIMFLGYINSFKLIAFGGGLGLILVILMPSIPRPVGKMKIIQNLRSIPALVAMRHVQFAIITAFFAGLFAAITQSFFPIWLKGLGYTEGFVSIIFVGYYIGAMVAGVFFGYLFKNMRFPILMQIGLIGVGVSFISVSLAYGAISAVILNLSTGIFAGIIAVLYQAIAVSSSFEGNRGLLLSVVGLGWGIAFLIGPLSFGLLIDALSIQTAFIFLGSFILLFSSVSKLFYSKFIIKEKLVSE